MMTCKMPSRLQKINLLCLLRILKVCFYNATSHIHIHIPSLIKLL